jgi:hypothetical protein
MSTLVQELFELTRDEIAIVEGRAISAGNRSQEISDKGARAAGGCRR